MDNTKIDFNYSLEQIKRPIPLNYNKQGKYLNSDDINTAFKNMETSLNMLYENTRYLEDAISYCNAFLNLKIEEYNQDIQKVLKGIENIRDINKNSAYIEYLCSFEDDLSIKKDRNDTIISNMLLKEKCLMLGIKSSKDIEYLNTTKTSSFIPYYNNLENIKTEFYRTFYIEEKIANKGISETITINLEHPTEVNYIDIKNVNSTIENFRLVYVNGTEEYLEYENGIIPKAIVAQIKFDLVCKKYNTSTYYMQKDKITDDVWNKIKEYEFKYALDITSKLEMEEVIARIYGDSTEIYNTSFDKNNIVEKSMYNYMFGIDSIAIKNIEQEQDSCFISQPIDINELGDGEYIQMHVEEVLDEDTTIEYSILDGDVEIPVLPFGSKIIKNEKVFNALPLRFNQDYSLAVTIKKDGITTDISLDDAKTQLLSRFSVDYFPEENYNYKPINSNIKIKAVIRSYSNATNNSYLKAIKIRKYGGDVLWTDM